MKIALTSIVVLVATLAPQAHSQVAPSANKDRRGTYAVDTDVATYKYFVCVPEAYDGTRPAGIHLYFHGQNGQKNADKFGKWSKTFLEPFNLIGINMQYNDGDNYKDTENKVRVAMRAVRQVSADYKVLPYGAVASMSGGGEPLGIWFTAHGKANSHEPFWPFQHCSVYSSCFNVNATGGRPMSWFIGLGGKEWNKFGLGQSQPVRMAELLAETNHGGCPDLYLRLDVSRDHTLADADIAASAAMYRRTCLAFTPFVYPGDYPERELQPIVRSCYTLALGNAAIAVQKLLTRATTPQPITKKAQALKTLIDERVDADLKLSQQLSQEDPVLFAYYSKVFTGELAGHPRAKELSAIIATAKKEGAAQWAAFVRGFPGFFNDKPGLTPGTPELLGRMKATMPPQSTLGVMASEFLTLETAK